MQSQTKTIPVAHVFRALSDRTRLRILNLLRDGELCVCDLVDVLDVPQPTASRHLAYLRKTNLVSARKEGLWHYYRITPNDTPFYQSLWECLAACESTDPALAADRQQLQSASGRRCCD